MDVAGTSRVVHRNGNQRIRGAARVHQSLTAHVVTQPGGDRVEVGAIGQPYGAWDRKQPRPGVLAVAPVLLVGRRWPEGGRAAGRQVQRGWLTSGQGMPEQVVRAMRRVGRGTRGDGQYQARRRRRRGGRRDRGRAALHQHLPHPQERWQDRGHLTFDADADPTSFHRKRPAAANHRHLGAGGVDVHCRHVRLVRPVGRGELDDSAQHAAIGAIVAGQLTHDGPRATQAGGIRGRLQRSALRQDLAERVQ